ncbi:MFS transporter [Leisingera daeponensis]|uniref:MFS transporter n=1 Tax=Leisingera daeponensis TaxID=405746 RepID=UPI001C952963|nr:MFS transporter [Leisingera daeponensis]MBY6059018.1 MFS transporter [Leisingera daeponensis]
MPARSWLRPLPGGTMGSPGVHVFGLIIAVTGIVTVEFMIVGLLPAISSELQVSLQKAGLLVSVFALSAAVAGPVVTFFTAAVPARVALSLGLIAFGLANVVVVVSPEFEVAVLARAVQGALLTPLVSVGSDVAARLAAAGAGGRAIGQVNFGTVLGTVIAVPSAVLAVELVGWQGIYVLTGTLVCLAGVLIWSVLPQLSTSSTISATVQARLLTRPGFAAQLIVTALLFTGMFTIFGYIPVYLAEVFSLTGPDVGCVLFGFGAAGFLGNWLASRLIDRDPKNLTVAVSLILACVMFVSAADTPGLILGGAIIVLWGGTHTAAFVVCQVRVMKAGAPAAAFAGSLNISAANLGIAAGSWLGGTVVRYVDVTWLGPTASAVCVCAALLSFRLQGADSPAGETIS